MKSNLPKFLENPLSNLRGIKQIIFASADKSLGPVAMTLDRYIKDALTHLLDSNTYEILSSAEAEARDKDLSTAISNWISEYAIDLNIDTRRYLRKKTESYKGRPFWIFLPPLQNPQDSFENKASMLRLRLHSPRPGNLGGLHAPTHCQSHAFLF